MSARLISDMKARRYRARVSRVLPTECTWWQLARSRAIGARSSALAQVPALERSPSRRWVVVASHHASRPGKPPCRGRFAARGPWAPSADATWMLTTAR